MSRLGNVPAGTKERIAEQRLRAFELRKGGASYRAIGAAIGVSEATAFRYVVHRLRAIQALEEAPREQVRAMELERIDALFLGSYPRATQGDPQAVRSCVMLLKRRAEMLGLDAPTKHEHTGADGDAIVVKWGTPGGTLPASPDGTEP